MRFSRNIMFPMVALAVVGGMATISCSSKKKSSPAAAAPAAVDRNVVISGSLNIVSNSSSASLMLRGSSDATAVGNYRVNCVTFEDTPKAGYADVSADGSFTATLEGFAGAPFGCFLLQKQASGSFKNISSIVFDSSPSEAGDEDSQLLAGAGTLSVKLAYDADLGAVSAVVDTTKSTALEPAKVEAMKTAIGAATTQVENMTGTYGLQCVGIQAPNDPTGPFAAAGCNEMKLGGDMPTSIYFHEFAEGSARKVSIWQDTAAITSCFGSANPTSELDPQFGAKLTASSALVEFDMSNLASLQTSFDSLITQLDHAALTEIVDATANTWQVENCQRMEQQLSQMQNAFSADTCKFFAPGVELKKEIQPDGSVAEWEMMKWYDSLQAVNTDITAGNAKAIADNDADLTLRTQTCWNPEKTSPRDNMPPCPWDYVHPNNQAEPLADETISFQMYEYKVGTWPGGEAKYRPANFACTNPFGGGMQQFPVTATTTAGNVTHVQGKFSNADNMGTMNKECRKITNPWTGSGQIYSAQANEVRRTFFNLMRQAKQDKGSDDNLCTRFQRPSPVTAFNFTGWNDGMNPGGGGDATNGTKWNQAGGSMWWSRMIWQQLRIKPEIGADGIATAIVADDTQPRQPWFDYDLANDTTGLCPAVNPTGPSQGQSNDAYNQALQDACRTEFLATGTLSEKLTKIFNKAINVRNTPPDVLLQCKARTDGSSGIGTFVAGLAQNSCIPDFDLMTRCDGGQCVETLRCWGTEDGACVDAAGKYKGRLPGRMDLMTLKPRVGNAFDLTANNVESWEQWEDNQPKVCKRVNALLIQAEKESEGVFSAVFNENSNQFCEGETPREPEDRERIMLRFSRQ